MPKIAPLRPGDPSRLGPFVLSGRVGEGGQGIVYLGETQEGERAAIKLLHVKFTGDAVARSRFARELRAAQRVASFCTARVIAADLEGDTPYIASEYIEGRSLRDTVEANGPIKGSELERLAVGTATALTAIHHAGIVHRDFKPDNVLIAADGPRVVDFGIARIVDSTGTITSRAIGTPAYMAPEQISGATVGPPTDVFAWGSTIAYAATGKAAFGGDSIAVVLNRVLNHDIDVTSLPEPLRGVVRSCLSKASADRPTADQILLRLLGRSDSGDASTIVMTQGVQVANPEAGEATRLSALPTGLPPSLPARLPTGLPSDLPAGLPSGLPPGLPPGAPVDVPMDANGGLRAGFGGPPPVITSGVRPSPPPDRRSAKGRWIAVIMTSLAVVALGGVVIVTRLLAAGTADTPSVTSHASPDEPMTFSSIVDKAARTKRLTIGVKGDLPGIGLRQNGVWTGFDADVARFVARKLGVPASGITFKMVKRADRAKALTSGTVDLVVATYAHEHNGDDPVTFAGPYFTAHTDVLVLRGSKIRTAADLDGKRLCNPQGSESVGVVQDQAPGVELVAAGEYAECIRMLTIGTVDAIPGDDVILAGFANREKSVRFAVLGLKIDNSGYSVGLPKDDVRACSAVRTAIAVMYKEGKAAQYLKANFGNVDFTPEAAAPAAISCR